MENIKITVLRLSGCGWCEEVTKQLSALGIKFESLDADKESDLADRWESLLDTLLYPIIQVDRPIDTWYIFRPQNEKEIGKITPMGFKNFKLGCNTIADIVNEVKKLA
jgi:glutaredoxin